MGASTESIAQRLSISERTVRNHINNMLAKLGVHSRLEAVAYSIRNGLL
jgi:two-component system nitrate/nitrite response regulator NarL